MKLWRDKTLDELDAEYRAALEKFRASPEHGEWSLRQQREREREAGHKRSRKHTQRTRNRNRTTWREVGA